ncbi:MAG TPA: type II CRISPR-associated endonuclease Cas1 [bacterium]|nr:type II CRISPR-associated endonuclease Cas1 [bacterium]
MDEKIIDIADKQVALSARLDQLRLKSDDGEVSVPLEEVTAVVVSHPAVHYTHATLSGLCAAGAPLIVCNEKRLPVGMLVPLVGHYVQAERLAAQAESTLPARKFAWKQVVRSKILSQARLLMDLGAGNAGLVALARGVRSGDPDNLEAQAARRYWPLVFGAAFARVPGADDPINRLLNYGYAILRAIVARGLCGAGLHPSLGIHHHNRYNPYCLADDLMEPFRPLVDRQVRGILDRCGPEPPLDRSTKETLIGALLNGRVVIGGEERSLFDATTRMSASLAGVLSGQTRRLLVPSW